MPAISPAAPLLILVVWSIPLLFALAVLYLGFRIARALERLADAQQAR